MLTTYSHYLFSEKCPFKMTEWVLNKPLMRLYDFYNGRKKERICLEWANMLNIFKIDHKDRWWMDPVHWCGYFFSDYLHVIVCQRLIFSPEFFYLSIMWLHFWLLKISFQNRNHCYWKIYISSNIVFTNRSWRNRADTKFRSGFGVIDTIRRGKISLWSW